MRYTECGLLFKTEMVEKSKGEWLYFLRTIIFTDNAYIDTTFSLMFLTGLFGILVYEKALQNVLLIHHFGGLFKTLYKIWDGFQILNLKNHIDLPTHLLCFPCKVFFPCFFHCHVHLLNEAQYFEHFPHR